MAPPSGSERHSVAPAAPDSSRDVVQEDFLFHLYRGSELLQENRVLEAKEELEYALTVQPLDAKGQDLLGTVYFRLGLYPRAIQIYEALEPQFPRDASVKINLALAYLKTGQAEPARRVLKDAVGLQPDHKRAWGYLGLALQKLGEFEQAQAAFERGGHPLMARRVNEKRRQSFAPPALMSSTAMPSVPAGVREAAEAAFTELDAGDLTFSLARSEQPKPGSDAWHPHELGWSPVVREAATPGGLPAAVVDRSVHESVTRPPPSGVPADAGAPPPPVPSDERVEHITLTRELPPAPGVAAHAEPPSSAGAGGLPAPLHLHGEERIALLRSGVLIARASQEASQSIAARLEAVRILGASATTRVLHRRRDDAEVSEVMGGVGSPMVQITGEGQVVLGPRPGHTFSLIALRDGGACVLEDRLVAFQLGLAFDCGRVAFEYPGERPRGGANDGVPMVQLRGTGGFALELAGPLSSVVVDTGGPLLVRREWIVGWTGRLAARALPPAEAPGGQRGLVGFAGDGTVLVCLD
jgi:Flp pilus assembly protein TadD